MKSPAKRISLAMALVLFAGNAMAMNSEPAQDNAAVSTKAVLGFRIVIQDSLKLDGPASAEAKRGNDALVSHTITFEDGRQVITRAKP